MIRLLEWATAWLVVTSALMLRLIRMPDRRSCGCRTCTQTQGDSTEWVTELAREAA